MNSNTTLAISLLCCFSGPVLFIVLILLIRENQRQNIKKEQQISILLKEINFLKEQMEQLKSSFQTYSLNEWFKKIRTENYRNEIEVEIKFIYPLLLFLGYKNEDLKIRVSVRAQLGRQIINTQADWVIYYASKVNFVVEAKEPNQDLTATVQKQARSYAYGLNAPFYLITNGRKLQIYKRGIQEDECLIDCDREDMESKWQTIDSLIGVTNDIP